MSSKLGIKLGTKKPPSPPQGKKRDRIRAGKSRICGEKWKSRTVSRLKRRGWNTSIVGMNYC
jgi:hypothetical protein